jgi:hypothetical protein
VHWKTFLSRRSAYRVGSTCLSRSQRTKHCKLQMLPEGASGADTESLSDNSACFSNTVSILYNEHDGFVAVLAQSCRLKGPYTYYVHVHVALKGKYS